MMKHLEALLFVVALTILVSFGFGYESKLEVESEKATAMVGGIPITPTTPPCIRLYYYIEKYAQMYDIPLKYAYGIANVETGYTGPFHWTYSPGQTSPAGAVGPMQIMPATAKLMWPDSSIEVKKLRTDLELNVHTSMKLLRHLKDKYHDWKLVFGCYNTGRPMINGYAEKVYSYNPKFK